MAYWLFKSEPDTYSWDQLMREGRGHWDGVRNYQARNNMKAMKIGDLGFFYHSNTDREIVGIVRVIKEYYPDHTDETGRYGMVDVEPVTSLKTPVTLKSIKANPHLEEMALVRHSRLSVSPVTPEAWHILCAMGGVKG